MAYEKQRHFCASLRRKCMKIYLKKLTEKGLAINKSFWKFMKPFLTNKGFIDVTLMSEEKQLTKLFDSILEKDSGTTPKIFGTNF